jgi:IPT/TIG domain
MRSRRTLPVRLASLGGAVALAAAGLAGTVGLALAVPGGTAGADVTYNSSCNLPVFGPTTFPITVTGQISPSPVSPGGSFNLSNFSLKTQFPQNLATLIAGGTIGGSATMTVTSTGATPSGQTATFTIPTIHIPNPVTGPISVVAPGSMSSFTANSTGSTSVSLNTSTTATLNSSLNGAAPIAVTCTSASAEQIATAQIHTPAGQLQGLLPNAGASAGGTSVKIVGTFLSNPSSVTFGGVPAASFRSLTSNSILAVSPPGTVGSTADVEVTTPSGPSSTEPFTYTDGPIVTGLSPSTQPPAGGGSVTITGTGFTGASDVNFGSNAAHGVERAHFTVNSDTSITATAPAGSGVVNVTVTVPGANLPTSPAGLQNRFNYRAGYWLGASDGGVFTYGNPPFEGSAGNLTLNKPVVGMAATPDGGGYWLVASDGGVFSYGDAVFYGSTGNLTLNSPVVGIAATPDGFGYWMVAADGGVFSFGDAEFFGSMGGAHLNAPVVGMAPTTDGNGYWMVAKDGGVFSFGDAVFQGSAGALALVAPVVGIAAAPGGNGYWLGAADGGVFNYGSGAQFFGSAGGLHLNAPVVGIAASPDGMGYWLVATDGGIFSYGDAVFWGSAGGLRLNQPMVGMAAVT